MPVLSGHVKLGHAQPYRSSPKVPHSFREVVGIRRCISSASETAGVLYLIGPADGTWCVHSRAILLEMCSMVIMDDSVQAAVVADSRAVIRETPPVPVSVRRDACETLRAGS